MTGVLTLLLGVLVQLVKPASPAVSVLAGIAIGLASTMVADARHRPKQTYMPPTTRPGPTTAMRISLVAGFVLAIGSAFLVALWLIPMPRLPLFWGLGFYMGGLCIGIGAAMLLKARKSAENHNNWLASMTPRTSLDTEL